MTNMEKLEAIVVQLGESQARADGRLDRAEAILDRLAGSSAEFDREREKSAAEFDREREKSTEEYYKWRKEVAKEFDLKYGSLGDRLGEITEIVVIPGVRPALSKLGRNFERIVSNKVI